MEEVKKADKKVPKLKIKKPALPKIGKEKEAPAPALAPIKLKLLVTVVNRGKAEFYVDLLQSFDVNMQMTVLAKGTAKSETLHMLGLEESDKSVIFSILREDQAKAAMEMLDEKFSTIRNGKGIAYTVPLTGTIGVAIYRFLSNNRKNVKEEK